jgi:hypothetical protein
MKRDPFETTEAIGMRVEDYTSRKNTHLDKDRKAHLTSYQRKWLWDNVFPECRSIYISQIKKYMNKSEEMGDIEAEAYEAFSLTAVRFNPRKISYKYKKKVVYKGQNKIDLTEKVFATKRFKTFIVQFFKKQVPVSKLKASSGEDYPQFLKGSLEWLRRQFIHSFKQYVEWCRMENQLRLNKSRNSIKSHHTSLSETEVQNSIYNLSAVNENDPLYYLSELLKKEDDVFKDFLVDKLVKRLKEGQLRKRYGEDFDLFQLKAKSFLTNLETDGVSVEKFKSLGVKWLKLVKTNPRLKPCFLILKAVYLRPRTFFKAL